MVLHCMSQHRIYLSILFVSLRLLFIVVILLNISLHLRPLETAVNEESRVVSHDHLGVADILQSKITSTNHSPGRSPSWKGVGINYIGFDDPFSTCSRYTGWKFTDFA